MEALARAAGAACLTVCLLGIASATATGHSARLLEIQLGTDATVVRRLLSDPERRTKVRRALRIDFAFIAAYWLAFLLLAILVADRGGSWLAVGIAAACAATATALFDLLENLRTLALLTPAREDTVEKCQLDRLRRTSLAKWGGTALTVALLASLFFRDSWLAVPAAGLVAVALFGLAALRWRNLIEYFFLAVFAATILIAILSLGWPSAVTSG